MARPEGLRQTARLRRRVRAARAPFADLGKLVRLEALDRGEREGGVEAASGSSLDLGDEKSYTCATSHRPVPSSTRGGAINPARALIGGALATLLVLPNPVFAQSTAKIVGR